jgi:hypothetical protein
MIMAFDDGPQGEQNLIHFMKLEIIWVTTNLFYGSE